MTDVEPKTLDPAQREIMKVLAISLWRAETSGGNAKGAAPKKEEFKGKRQEYTKKARKLMRLLEKQGVSLEVSKSDRDTA
ncbi:MAG: hypothetical protein MK160_02790 [Rhodobacteraceae bacterium]|nr:hypothetical protein [Paracoccaceae bacterium]